MTSNSVCAVVVTFRPDITARENFAAVRPQVQGMVVVDNGSPDASLGWIRAAGAELDFSVIENGENRGLPVALNAGIEWATTHGYRWVVLFDQDSTVTEGLIDTMLEEFERLSSHTRVGIVAPRYVNRDTGEKDIHSSPKLADGGLDAAWTSGSLIPITVFKDVGGFEPSLVIDLLDYEFSLRVRSAGYVIAECAEAVLLHTPGFPTRHRLLGISSFTTDGHSPARRYYRFRNRIWIVKRYRRKFRGLALHNLKMQLKEAVKIALGERSRWTTFKFIARGICDGIIGRTGKTVEI